MLGYEVKFHASFDVTTDTNPEKILQSTLANISPAIKASLSVKDGAPLLKKVVNREFRKFNTQDYNKGCWRGREYRKKYMAFLLPYLARAGNANINLNKVDLRSLFKMTRSEKMYK